MREGKPPEAPFLVSQSNAARTGYTEAAQRIVLLLRPAPVVLSRLNIALKLHVTGYAGKAYGPAMSQHSDDTTFPILTSGSMEATFEEAIASIQNYGFRQTVFQVERLTIAKNGHVSEKAGGERLVLRPSAAQEEYPQMKRGDQVQCPGLRKETSGSPAHCRILRLAEGTSRNNMTERV